MSKYDFTAIEAKWQRYWAEHDTFHAEDDYTKPKFYALVEFPYPSGQGLHIGHPRPYTAMDVVSRKRRMEGYNVLFPMGWDAFGLPTENYAIKHKIHPAIVTANNVARFKSQLQALGMSFDWDREINTTDPNYFHWTQWIFLQMFKKGLAYKKETAVNWCTSCKVVLANEEVVGGVCERCGGEVVQKVKSQWMLKITEYAQRLLDDLDEVDYLEKIKTAQRNWIGRSTGAEVDFQTTAGDTLKIYTTRPDTLFGATYMVISPEHPLIEKWAPFIERMRALYEQAGISTILVAGSSGAFFYEADRVIQMDRYHVVDITEKVRNICGQNACGQHVMEQVHTAAFEMPVFDRKSPAAGHKREVTDTGRERGGRRGRHGSGAADRPRTMKVKIMGKEMLMLDKENVDLRYTEQLADSEQTTALAYFMRYLLEKAKSAQTVRESVSEIETLFEKKGWQAFCSGYVPCGLARPRTQEIYAVLNRYRG